MVISTNIHISPLQEEKKCYPHLAYPVEGCLFIRKKAEKDIDFIQDGGKIQRQKDLHHHGKRPIVVICHLPDPPPPPPLFVITNYI